MPIYVMRRSYVTVKRELSLAKSGVLNPGSTWFLTEMALGESMNLSELQFHHLQNDNNNI